MNYQLIRTNSSQQVLDNMPSKMDSAIAGVLSLQEPLPEMEAYGASGFASIYKITTKADGQKKVYFVKTGGPDAEIMFTGELG